MPPEVEGPVGWLEKARRDLTMAEPAQAQGKDFADQVCFHAQQCAEKALKAVLIAAGRVPPHVHDLGVVLDAIVGIEPAADWDLLREPAERLSDFSVGPRYPGWDVIADAVEMEAVLGDARAILQAVERHVAGNLPRADR